MHRFVERFSAIESLSQNVVELLNSTSFEQANQLLVERQTQLQSLDNEIKAEDKDQTLIDAYQCFLLNIQQIDQGQISKLLDVRKDLVKASLKQQNNNAAISAYKGIKFV